MDGQFANRVLKRFANPVRKRFANPVRKRFAILAMMFALLAGQGMAQEAVYKFWVQFSDKNHNSYTIENPGEFLSRRAIDRRARQEIPITMQDLPVSGAYLDSLSVYPLKILYTSKWMNSAIVKTGDSSLAVSLPENTYIEDVRYLFRDPGNKKSETRQWDKQTIQSIRASQVTSLLSAEVSLVSDHQVEMLNGDILHSQGYTGRGIHIAVLDLGFLNVNTLTGFDSLFLTGRILGTRNFVEPDSGFYWSNGSHGTNVLSIMGGNIPGEFRGSAPGASYWLIQTEDKNSEYRIEEANWLAGAELADSAGADIINSSLGYLNVFTDPSQNYSYSDLDGKTALVTRAAQIAATKGMLVVTSAGNSGRPGNSWGYISTPADGDSVLSVGAVDADGRRADFSSYGPTFDSRIKPDIAAQGEATWYINQTGTIEFGNGTSYSSPVVAGLAACLWQKNPGISNMDLFHAIRQSGSLSLNPDTLLGYGIPDFARADQLITGISASGETDYSLIIFPNPAGEYISIITEPKPHKNIQYRIYDISGRLALSGVARDSGEGQIQIPIEMLSNGSYFLNINSGNTFRKGIFIKCK